ncbi:WD repeat-containing protein 75 [Sinocyclocheilus anshuiensis]|uniref:WD repeat-containing protein 75-like n=1 Tax=Sinocyclocheilus anshuiensis TaxID=1608454 RepID=A0A671T889_9TELE|nr:PREDICTED: WD repeat-containing protein 75-like [Sinocyclocheilus anshuiensis]XP_016305423.1 PREDICTED: WD repeat-containing protein 75-like [Sinocyclocheilus anshuiensis]
MVERSDIRVVRCGGSKVNLRPPIISTDSRFVLCASGDLVKVYSTRTEEWLHSLQGHTNQVTGIALNPANHLQVYSCSADGTVKLWDFIDGILIKTFIIGYPLFAIYVSEKHEGVLFLHVSMATDSKNECFQLVAVHPPKSAEQEVEAKEMSVVSSHISSNPSCTAFGRGGEYIAFARRLQLNVYFFRKQKTCSFSLKATDKKGAKNAFTCIACHPTDDCIATGHEDGKIRLWRNFIHKKEYTYSTQHWHHNAVNTLCFTPEGTHLLSGGIESVLVQWQYGAGNRKEFLPRLGGSILHISASSDGQLFCTSHSDNKITVIESSFKVCGVIQGLVKGDAVLTDLMIDPRSIALVLNGKPGHLQFYSLLRDKHLYNLDIVQQEYIYEAGLDQFEVVKAAFDIKGSWLATVEERGQKSSDLEFFLKLWAFDERTQSFVLNTTITAAHTDRIISMCFSSSEETTMLVTTAEDGQFKAWCQGADADTQQDQNFWSCDFVGSYHNLKPTNCSFSADSSLLAVSFQEVITIWSPETWEMLTTLCQPPGVIRDLCFGRLSCSKYLLGTTTRNLLCCWNLLTCALEWSSSVEVSKLQPDPLSENVAAFSYQSKHTDLFVFKPSEPRPLFTNKNVCSEKVHRAVFVPREEPLNNCDESSQWLNRSQLYFLTQNMDLLTFSTATEEDRMLSSSKQLVIDDSVAVTPFYLLLGKHRQQQQKLNTQSHPAADKPQQPQGSVTIKELLHTPAHVLPAASVLCSMFVNSLLISNTGVQQDPLREEMDSEKEEEDSEEEMEACDSQQELRVQGSVDEVTLKLSKAQERELKRVRKTDFSWMAGLIDSKP